MQIRETSDTVSIPSAQYTLGLCTSSVQWLDGLSSHDDTASIFSSLLFSDGLYIIAAVFSERALHYFAFLGADGYISLLMQVGVLRMRCMISWRKGRMRKKEGGVIPDETMNS